MTHPKSCFFISPIGAEKTEDRKRNNQVLKFIVDPVCTACGYAVTRADKIQEPGVITSQVVQQVLDSDLVIADLTGWNPNVFYELAIRHAFRKPYVQMIESNQRIPFDVAGVRTIQWDHHDLDSVEQCKADLEASIKAIEKDPKSIESPVSVAVDIQEMRRSGKPMEQSVADIRQSVEGLQQRFDEVLASMTRRPSGFAGYSLENPYIAQSNVSGRVIGSILRPLDSTVFYETVSPRGFERTVKARPNKAKAEDVDLDKKAKTDEGK